MNKLYVAIETRVRSALSESDDTGAVAAEYGVLLAGMVAVVGIGAAALGVRVMRLGIRVMRRGILGRLRGTLASATAGPNGGPAMAGNARFGRAVARTQWQY